MEDCEKTLSWLGERVAAMGISRLANITGLDVIGLPVFVAIRPASRSFSVAQGKGRTICEAKVSALMEAAEGFHAERIQQPIVMARRSDFGKSSAVIDTDLLPIAEGFDGRAVERIRWVRGWEIVSEQQIWVPYDLVSTAYTVEMADHYSGLYASTTGLAAGCSIAEAVDHGLLEVVERDATLLHLLMNKECKDQHRISLSSISEPSVRQLLQLFWKNNIFVAVWDATSDIGIPCFFCVIAAESEKSGETSFFAGGAGCDPDKRRAISAALAEAAQSRLTTISGAREDLDCDDYSYNLNSGFLEEFDVLRASEGRKLFSAIPSYGEPAFESRLHFIAANLFARGMKQIIVVNLYDDAIRIPVVKIIVPGMEVAIEAVGSKPGVSMTRRAAL